MKMQKGCLVSPENTIAVLKKYRLSAKKHYGQNFLIDERVLSRILLAAEISEEDVVLEIGPGIGTLTEALLQKARSVIAVEIDKTLIPVLSDTLSGYDNLDLRNEDILKTDIKGIVLEKNGGAPIKVVANLPYYITTPILLKLLESGAPIKSITVMVQLEVAERMKSSPGSKDYGALSLAIQYYAEPELNCRVPGNSFLPRPNVDSAVITLRRREEPPVETKDREAMFRLIKGSFQQRRKTLLNGILGAGIYSLSKEEIRETIEEAGFSPSVRGETLSLWEFAVLSDLLIKKQEDSAS